MNSFKNVVAAVTGAGSGIGRQLAIQLAEADAVVALSDINRAELEQTRELILGKPGCSDATVSLHTIDVADSEQVARYAAEVVQQHGRVNLLINNAGVALSADTADANYEDMHWLMNINYWGVVYGCKEFLPHLLSSSDSEQQGHIVNISSVFGLMSVPSQSAYNSSKFAVRGFSEALRMELFNKPLNVSTAFPAGIKTNIARNARNTIDNEEELEARLKKTEHLFNNSAERAARDILNGVLANESRIMVGQGARRIDFFTRLAPKWVSKRVMRTSESLE